MAKKRKLRWMSEPKGDGFYWMYQPAPDVTISVCRVFGGGVDVSFVDADYMVSVDYVSELVAAGSYRFMGPLQRPAIGKTPKRKPHGR
jgi:hypothetical protein